jgi:hypothetical protein
VGSILVALYVGAVAVNPSMGYFLDSPIIFSDLSYTTSLAAVFLKIIREILLKYLFMNTYPSLMSLNLILTI